MGAAANYRRSSVSTYAAWQQHVDRVRQLGGAAAVATIDLTFVKLFFQQVKQLNLRVLADLSPRFGCLVDAQGRVIRLFEPAGKDLVVPAGYVGPTLSTANGHPVLVFDGNSLLISANEQAYDLLAGDLVSYAYANTASTSATSSVYAKAIAGSQEDRYALLYDGGMLYSLFQDTQEHHAAGSAPASGAWQEIGQRVRRAIATNDVLVSRQVAGQTAFAVNAEEVNASYQFCLGGYTISGNANGDTYGFFFSGQLDRVRLLRSWPGAAADTTIWNTLTS